MHSIIVVVSQLYELVSGADQHEIVPIFGRDQTQQSRAFKYFVDHIYDIFLHLVISHGGMRMDICHECGDSQMMRSTH